jgi:predicted ATPase
MSDSRKTDAAEPPLLVGRSAELDLLHAALRDGPTGHPRMTLIRGIAGVGKTALLDRFAREVDGAACVMRGPGYERESPPYRVFDSVTEALGTHALPPRVLLVDDLQSADVDSARMLSHVFGSNAGAPLQIVGAYRNDEGDSSDFIRELLGAQPPRSGQPQLLELSPLSRDAAIELTHALLASGPLTDPRMIEVIVDEAQGMPHFIAQLVQHGRARGCLEDAASSEPLTLKQALIERIAGLPEPEQQLLRVLSVAAGPLAQRVALAAAGLPQGEQISLKRLRSARLVRSRGGGPPDQVETYHARVRDAVMSELPPALAHDIHRRIISAQVRRGLGSPGGPDTE